MHLDFVECSLPLLALSGCSRIATSVVLSRTKYLNFALLSGKNGLSIYFRIDSSSRRELTDEGPHGLGKASWKKDKKYEQLC